MQGQALPGFRDFNPAEAALRNQIFGVWRAVATRYGFEEYDGPPFEPLELYTGKSGDEIVGQLYELEDKGGRRVARRPEMTPSLARMVAARASALKKPIRWFAIPQLFRYERQQRGRLREHFQFNMDLIGEPGPLADAEIAAAAVDVMRGFGLGPEAVRLRLSDRRVVSALLRHAGVPDALLPAAYAAIDKIEREPAVKNAVPLKPDFGSPTIPELRRGKHWNFKAALTFVTTPNAPSGRGYSTRKLDFLCQAQRGVVVLDEAYVDFAEENAMSLTLKHPHVLVARTFSKAYSLCFQRVGYFVGNAELIAALHKIRDSYNVNGLGQIAAEATLQDLPYYRANFRRIIATRQKLSGELTKLGFCVLPSQANFILTKPSSFAAKDWLEKLRHRKILVRWFSAPELEDYLRITIGTPEEAAKLLKVARAILR